MKNTNNKQEIIKTIQTQEKKLSDLKLNIVDLELKDSEDNDYYFLEENLKEYLIAVLEEKKIKGNVKSIGYSLSYCQGDGFMFEGEFEYKGCVFRVEHQGNYYHENSKSINISTYKDKYDDEWTEKESKKIEELEEEFDNIYVDICKRCEKEGYSMIEGENEDTILKAGFRRFLEENNINPDYELLEFNYSNEGKEGFVKVCDGGDSYIKGLWVEDFKIKVEDKVKASCDIEEYQDIEVIL